MIAYMFCIDAMIQGYLEYQSIWDNPLADGDLLCEQEMGNSCNRQAMTVTLGGDRWYLSCKLLGMFLRIIFQTICSIFT